MPPFSRGRPIVHFLSTTSPSAYLSKSSILNNAPKSKLPSKSQILRSAERDSAAARAEAANQPPGKPQPPPGPLRQFISHPRYRYIRRFIMSMPIIVVGILHLPYEVMPVSGPSMSPFLNPKSPDKLPSTDYILLHKIHDSGSTEGAGREQGDMSAAASIKYSRGQIVVYMTPHNPDKIAVKRVVAVAGDLVEPLPGYPGGDGPVVVPWNHVWVEGDVGTRKESQDSNYFGPLSQSMIMGEVQSTWTSGWFWNWKWVDWKQHSWPARQNGRVHEGAVSAATVDPDDIAYGSGWSNGSIALILQRMRQQPDELLRAFVGNPEHRQETRRLYNNALYVADIAESAEEKQLAIDVSQEMEMIYGREALVFGIRVKRQPRNRGELPNAVNSSMGEKKSKDADASVAEKWLRKQGWELERNKDGSVKTLPAVSS